MSVWAILLAGGNGTRMGAEANKTMLRVGGVPGLCRAAETLKRHCDGLVLVTRPQDGSAPMDALRSCGMAAERTASAGQDRQQSVLNGLEALPEECDIVLIHDGARPLVDDMTVENVIASAREYGSGIPCTAVTDTLKRTADGCVIDGEADRSMLRAVQTPQAFKKELILQAHRGAVSRCTDDAALVSALGVPVRLCPGGVRNIKLTIPEDCAVADFYALGMPRVGHGYDAHRLTEGRKLILGGVEIPYEKGLLGHSDADVLLHALTDALLGAAALGDIGQHFSDKDPQYKGISSLILLKKAAEILKSNGFVPYNVDVTVIAQRPKLMGYIPQMRQNIAETLELPIGRVSVKATTTEQMGFEGRGEGISAHAVALVYGKE